MNWFSGLISSYPSLILGLIFTFSMITIHVSFNNKKLPNFEDPQLGFETRGSEISQRLVAWDKLLEESKPHGSLTMNPELFQKLSVSSIKNEIYEETVDHRDEETVKSKKEKSGKWQQINHIQFPKNDSQTSLDLKYYKFSRNSDFFCDSIQSGYAQIILSAKPGKNLFSYEAITDICKFQNSIESLPNYLRTCITTDFNSCCNIWSLPNFIISKEGLSNCKHITKEIINSTLSLIESCWRYYHEEKLSPNYRSKDTNDAPSYCSLNQNIYNIIHYVIDIDFSSIKGENKFLKDTSVYLPITKSSISLQLFHNIEDISFTSEYFTISAMDLGVKYLLFNEYLIQDVRYLILSSVFILTCVWFYTGCVLITILTITAIFFSLINAYFIYTFVFGLQFFPFMNILAIIVSLGIGSDDAYIICKVWERTKQESSHLSKPQLVHLVMKHSAIAVFVTALTTIAAFVSSYWSSVTAIRCFSIFAGLSVLINFMFMITWILSGIVISSEWPYVPILHFGFSNNVDIIYENILNMKSAFDRCIIVCIEKYNLFFIFIFGFISLLSTFSVLCWPKLQVPDSSEFQLFEAKHPFEQFDLVYKNRFLYNHGFSDENYEEKLPLIFVWGIAATDTGNYLDPTSRGKLQFDLSFDIASAESQEWLLKFCRRLRMQPFYRAIEGPSLSNCFIETFKIWMNQKCIDPMDGSNRFPCCENVTFPYPRRVFNACVLQAMSSLFRTENFLTSEVAGPRFSKNFSKKKIKAIVVEYSSNISYTTSFEIINNFYKQVNTWSEMEFKNAPVGMKNGWFISYLSFYDLQRTLTQDTAFSVFISMSVAFVVLFGVTVNVPLSLLTILTVTCIIFVSVSILIILGWKLNILESIAISVAIGMSVDFSLHYAVNYKLCADKTNRKACVIHSLSLMAAPSLMAAVTTGASGVFMIPSIVLPYIQIGIFLVVVSSISWIYATFFQMSLLYRYGPQNNFGQLSYPRIKIVNFFHELSCKSLRKYTQSLISHCKGSGVYTHEMQTLGKKENNTDRLRSESFSHGHLDINKLKPSVCQLSYRLEQLPPGTSSSVFVQDEGNERSNTYVEI